MLPMASTFDGRYAEWRRDLESALTGLYGARASSIAASLVDLARRANEARDDELHALDRRRADSPFWFQGRQRVGYMAYVDRFGGDLFQSVIAGGGFYRQSL